MFFVQTRERITHGFLHFLKNLLTQHFQQFSQEIFCKFSKILLPGGGASLPGPPLGDTKVPRPPPPRKNPGCATVIMPISIFFINQEFSRLKYHNFDHYFVSNALYEISPHGKVCNGVGIWRHLMDPCEYINLLNFPKANPTETLCI